MDIIVPHSIRKRELGRKFEAEAVKIFAKLKDRPSLAESITAKGLPERTTLHKVYATTADGARRLLFFCRHPATSVGSKRAAAATEYWVLLLYRDKNDPVGQNMSPRNPQFERQLNMNLRLALNDLEMSTPSGRRYDQF